MADELKKRAFFAVFALFLALLLFYLYFTANVVFNIIERKNLENEARIVNSDLRELELEYFSLNESVNLGLAYNLGFENLRKVYFAPSQSLAENIDNFRGDL